MRKHLGQAAWFTARRLHNLATIALWAALLLGAALGGLAWRLSQGPLEVPWLLSELEKAAQADTGPVRWSIGRASLAWEGFSAGVGQPLDIRLDDVAVKNAAGLTVARLPLVLASLSFGDLLAGRITVISAELRGASLRVVRGQDGGINVEFDGMASDAQDTRALVSDILAQLAEPIGSANMEIAPALRQLQRIVVRDGSLRVFDQALGTEWPVQSMAMEVKRRPEGGVDATAEVVALLGKQRVTASLRAVLREVGQGIGVRVTVGPLNPSHLATDVPALGRLAAVDVPVTVDGTIDLDTGFAVRQAEAKVRFGAGTIAIGRSAMPLAGGSATLVRQADGMLVNNLAVELAPKAGGVSRLTGQAALRAHGGRLWADATVDLDRLDVAALRELWPDGTGTTIAKAWVVENITSGSGEKLHVAASLVADADFSGVRLTALTGGFAARDLTVHWLRPVPPIEEGVAQFEIVSPDAFDIVVASGRQGGIAIGPGSVRISGLLGRDQVLDAEATITAPVAEAIALLRQPKLRVLDGRPIELRNPAGQVQAKVALVQLPLEVHIDDSDINFQGSAKLTGLRLGGLIDGQDLDQGNLDLTASSDGLKAQGTARIAGIPAKVALTMDFRPGLPAAQVVQTATAAGSADVRQIAALGLDLSDILSGTVGGEATWRARQDGKGDLTVKADVTAAALGLPALSFAKPLGRPASADIHLLVEKERITAIDRLKVSGQGIDVDAQIEFAGGQPVVAHVQRAILGANDARGDIRWPTRAGGPWQINLTGASLDASAYFRHRDPATAKPKQETLTPPYVIDAKLGRIVLGEGRVLNQMVVRAESDGRIMRLARLSGRAGSAAGTFEISIDPAANARTLKGRALDAGGLLQALGVVEDMRGGEMTLSGTYDDTKPNSPLAGRAEIADFRMLKAPGLAKLLQAMTLYGLVEMVQGPGLGFTKLEVPFKLADDVLELDDARAFNASLGMTAKGRVDLATNRCDLEGTLVPAYFFNSLLGDLPIIGKLFSPERGGGLFAATYSLGGNCNDPVVGVNPLAALTPGFLRGLFGLFDTTVKPGDPGSGARAPGPSR